MQCLRAFEVVHDELGHFLNQAGNEMGLRRDMFALADFHVAGPEISRVCRQAVKRDTVEVKDHRGAKTKGSGIAGDFINQVKNPVELRDRIFRFAKRNRFWTINERRLRRNAVALPVVHF